MKKVIYATLLCALSLGVVSCSNGDYQADPASNANGAVNPLTPLTEEEFTWGGDEIMVADINGNRWEADSVYFALDTSGGNVLIGTKKNSTASLRFYLKDVWTGNLYSMEWEDYNRNCMLGDSVGGFYKTYYSFLSNSGGIKITRNDSAAIKGLFYFKGVSADGKVANISKGYFNIDKL